MEYAVTKYWPGAFSRLDDRNILGNILDSYKKFGVGRCTNVDPLDLAAFAGRSVDEPMLESAYTACICLYAGIGRVEVMANVGLISDIECSMSDLIFGNEVIGEITIVNK